MHLFTRRVGFLFVFVSCYIGLVLHLLHFCVCTFVWFLHLIVNGICLYICLVSCLIWCYSNSPERYYSSIHWCWQGYVKSSCWGRVKWRSCILWWILEILPWFKLRPWLWHWQLCWPLTAQRWSIGEVGIGAESTRSVFAAGKSRQAAPEPSSQG